MAEKGTVLGQREEEENVDKGSGLNGLSYDSISFTLTSYLDEVDDRIENLQKQARELIQERESLLTVLVYIREDSTNSNIPDEESQDLLATVDRLKKRCEAVDVKVHTVRNDEQENALSKVESLVEDLERICVLEELDCHKGIRGQAQGLLNACVSDAPARGPIDYKFQEMILGCKLEDQKLIRRRLECLVKGRCHEDFVEIHISRNLSEGTATPQPASEDKLSSSSNSLNGIQS